MYVIIIVHVLHVHDYYYYITLPESAIILFP
jgi:hypothetical protein